MAATNLPRVPEGLRDLMKLYTKEVLREKPTNLYEFSSDYFERLADKRGHQKVLKYEPPQSYEIIMKNRIRQQVPISLVFNIIPDNLTELIKKFIKAVLREKPENLLLFAVEYFSSLRNANSPRMLYTKYSAYEKYVDEKASSFAPEKKCACGRILSSKSRELEAAIKEESVEKEAIHSVQYLRAVCIIQKQIRKYLKKKKTEKKKSDSKELYNSQDYINAIFLIQRQIRRYLAKRKAEKIVELKKQNRYSIEYMNAIIIIQRYCRRYLQKRKVVKSPLNKNKTSSKEISLTTAAFIIQRAFRNMVKTRRAKRHINAELDQIDDDVNDNASEAASYTSASTALLSTESACEHNEFGGGSVYEEGVHQQTIREDEEVENDNTNNSLQSEFIAKAIKSKGKSINSNGNGNDLDIDNLHDEMDNIKKRGLYSQKSRRDINSEPNNERPITSSGNSEDISSDVIIKSLNSAENILKTTLDDETSEKVETVEEEPIKKSVSHTESMEAAPNFQEQSPENSNLKRNSSASENIKDNQLENIEDAITTLDNKQKDQNLSNTETAIQKSISHSESLEKATKSNELGNSSLTENTDLQNITKEEIISQAENLETAAQSDEVPSLTKSPSQEINIEDTLTDQTASKIEVNQDLEAVDNNLVDSKNQLTPEISSEEKPTSADEEPLKSMETNADFIEPTTENTEETETPSSESDYSEEVNSLQTVLSSMKEKNNQEEILDTKESTKVSPTEEGNLDLQTSSTSNMESDTLSETKDYETTKDGNSDLETLSLPKKESADSTTEIKEPKEDITNLTKSETKYSRENSVSNDIGESIIIHSVLPGEDDYILPLSTEVTLNPESKSDTTENVSDTNENIEENKNSIENYIDEKELHVEREEQIISKQDSAQMPVDESMISEIEKESIPTLTSSSFETDSTSKPVEEAKEELNESSKQMEEMAEEEEDLGDTIPSNANLLTDKQTSENIGSLEEQLESNITKSNDDPILESESEYNKALTSEKPIEEEKIIENIKESIKDLEIKETSDSSSDLESVNIKDIDTENSGSKTELLNDSSSVTEIQNNDPEIIKRIESNLSDNNDDVNKEKLTNSKDDVDSKSQSLDKDLSSMDKNTSVEELKELVNSESEPKTSVELNDESNLEENENINKTDNDSSVEKSEDKIEKSEIPAKQENKKSNETETDIIEKTLDENIEKTLLGSLNEDIQVKVLPRISIEAEKNDQENVKTPQLEETKTNIEDLVKTALSDENSEKFKEDNKADLSEKAQEELLTSSNEEYAADNIKAFSDVAEEILKNASNTEEVQDNIETALSEETVDNIKKTEDITEKPLAEENEDKIINDSCTTLPEDSQENNQEHKGKPLNLSNDDKVKDITESKASDDTEEIVTDKTETATSDENPLSVEASSEETKESEQNSPKVTSSDESVERSSSSNNEITDVTENTLILNNAKTISSESSKSKSIEKEDIDTTDTEVPANVSQITTDVKLGSEKDDEHLGDNSQKEPVKKDESIVEDTDVKAENNKIKAVKSDSQIAENKSSLLLTNQLTDTQIKKMPNVKDNKQHSTSFTSGRLTNAPVAELQLKSFKTDSDVGNWYDVYNESTEDDEDVNKDLPRLKRSQSEVAERRSNYFYGEESKSEETVKPKKSIAFFISFDGDDGKTSFKIPKRFLKDSETNNKKSKKKSKKEDDEDLEMEPIIPVEEDLIESDVGYSQYGVQKLQTIHELNENESSNELKSLMEKPDDNLNEQDINLVDSEIKFIVEEDDKINVDEEIERIDSTEEKETKENTKNDKEESQKDDIDETIAKLIKPEEVNENISQQRISENQEKSKKDFQSAESNESKKDTSNNRDETEMDDIDETISKLIKPDEVNEKISQRRLTENQEKPKKDFENTEAKEAKEDANDMDKNVFEVNADKEIIVKDNDNDKSHDFKRKRSAQIIQRAFKNYRERQEEKQNSINEDEEKELLAENKLNEDMAATRIQKAIRQFLARATQKPKENKSVEDRKYTNVEIFAAIRIQSMFRKYIQRKKLADSEDVSKATSATSLVTIIPNSNENETQTPDITLNEGELSDEMMIINSDVNSTKPEWFVGTQLISLEKQESVNALTETDTIGINATTDSTKLATDIGNINHELNACKVSAQDNGASNNSAGSTNETLEDLAIAAFGELDVTLKDTSTRQLMNEFLINEIEFSSIQEPYPYSQDNQVLEEVVEKQCIKKTVSGSNLSEEETKQNTKNDNEETQKDAMEEITTKLIKPVEVIEKMTQRKSSENAEAKKPEEASTDEGETKENTESDKENVQKDDIDKTTSKLMKTDEVIAKMEQRRSSENQDENFRNTEGEIYKEDSSNEREESQKDNIDETTLKLMKPDEVIEKMSQRRSSENLEKPKKDFQSTKSDETKEDTSNNKDETEMDAIDEATSKLKKPDEVIEKMAQRRNSETKDKLKDDFQITEPMFDEPIIRSMSSLQEQSSLDIEDGDIIVYNRLQRDETRESSAQSESVVFGNEDDETLLNNDTETARSQLSRHYTIAGEDPRVIFRSVTIDETVRYIENDNDNEDEDNGMKTMDMSFCLDDETSENIRKKMMAYSLSEGDSDYFDPSKIMQDDFHIDTAMTDAMDTSTETESTIVSAATKIQAGARGFLARRRLRRASAGTKSSFYQSTQDTKASFGNDAISESLERFIEEEAAKKIQTAYRFHSRKQKKANNIKSASLESSLAAKRQTLQRGDALRNDSNSTPEDENSSSTSVAQPSKIVEAKLSKDAATRSKRSTEYNLKWPAVRQNSMPVQIDCEVLRPIPKHMRRRIKSAENDKKKNRK